MDVKVRTSYAAPYGMLEDEIDGYICDFIGNSDLQIKLRTLVDQNELGLYVSGLKPENKEKFVSFILQHQGGEQVYDEYDAEDIFENCTESSHILPAYIHSDMTFEIIRKIMDNAGMPVIRSNFSLTEHELLMWAELEKN